MRNACALAVLLAAGTMTPAAAAQVPLAQSLFEEGRSLMAQGKAAEACPRFAESVRLDRRAVTMLNLAACHRAEGKTASAWVEFRQAEALSQREGHTERAAEAKAQADAVHAELSYVTFQASWSRPGESLLLDGAPIGRALWTTALPIDPGKHVVRVTAENAKSVELAIEVAPGRGTTPVTLPEPQPLPETSPEPAPPAPTPGSPAPGERPVLSMLNTSPGGGGGGGRAVAGLAVGGAGVVAIGVGAVFGLVAIGKKGDKNDLCPNDVCPDQPTKDSASRALSSAHTSATISTITIIAGAALVAGGAVLLLTKSSDPPTAASVALRAISTGAAF